MGLNEFNKSTALTSRPSARAVFLQLRRRELNYDIVCQKLTHIQMLSTKKRQELRAIGRYREWHTFCCKKSVDLDPVEMDHDCFRRSFNSRSCNLRV